MPVAARPVLRRKPARAAIARTNGARSRGPATEAGRRRSSLNALTHGLRARQPLALAALGEHQAEAQAQLAAVQAELGASAGPIARHLAETAASALWRAARAERLEGELLAGLAAAGRSVAAALHADREARATLALLLRYRREADGELRRTLDALVRLRRAQEDGLVPGEEAAERADAVLAEAAAELPEPSEPTVEKIGPQQAVAPAPASSPAAATSPPSAEELLRAWRLYHRLNPANGERFWRLRSPEEQAAMRLAAAQEVGPAKVLKLPPEEDRR